MDAVRAMRALEDPDAALPFIREILSTLRGNVGGEATVLGFVGTPWTLAAYAIEGAAERRAAAPTPALPGPPSFLQFAGRHRRRCDCSPRFLPDMLPRGGVGGRMIPRSVDTQQTRIAPRNGEP